MSIVVADEAERRIARDPGRSVIVQAPAGSGKTELLMQRYLALLACVDEPEQILAVTFTRKAAAEMRHRIITALQPGEPDERLPETAALATRVLERDRQLGWCLLEYPARLRIRTFDAVNSWITDCAPLLTGGGGAIREQVEDLYQLAARRTLEYLPESGSHQAPLTVVLRHLANGAERFIALMAQMLSRRDQWLPLLGTGQFDAAARQTFEASLRILVERELNAADAALTPAMRDEFTELLDYAAAHLPDASDDLSAWLGRQQFPSTGADNLGLWRALAGFCLVGNKAVFRKKVDKRNGFPTAKDGGDAQITSRAKEFLLGLASDSSLAEALHVVRGLPEPAYTDSQWEALQAMIEVLPLVAAELTLVFSERGETDFIQVAGDALRALENDGAPTALALRLDYRIQHILIDEFQDTSRAQFKLLQSLTEGWATGDGRSLMVVGDPMQSIYRFRQAEVSIYMELWQRGIGALELETVRLTSNFRSCRPVVDWVNRSFAVIMPAQTDASTGAVQFAESTATREAEGQCSVETHAFEVPARRDEALCIADLVEQTLARSATDTVGILVRTRHQARLIVPELRARGIAFSGAGLEQPGETAVEQDLIALTRALCHQADRTAWLALLRAPWCGLSLCDLEALCAVRPNDTVLTLLREAAPEFAGLSTDGSKRARDFLHTIELVLRRRGKSSLRDWVEGAWQQLGGPAALPGTHDLALAEQFFAALDEYDEGGDIAEAFLLHEQLPSREDRSIDAPVRVNLLTVFKAKGLEYDVVILPALDGFTRQDDKQVIAWHEFNGPDGSMRYLMAPIEPVGENPDPVQALIRRFDREQAANELDRLLYVATTRAIKQLHLCFELKRDKDGELQAPRNGTLLERLWPAISQQDLHMSGEPGRPVRREDWVQPVIRRISNPPAEPPLALAAPADKNADYGSDAHEVTYDWAGTDAMRIGSVVHRCLQFICEQQQPDWEEAEVIRRMLREEGVASADADSAAEWVGRALRGVREDSHGRWLLGDHCDGACEYPVTVHREGVTERLIIDRTFIDDKGVRWIVDYKTSRHEGGDLEGFINNEMERYAQQLDGYRAAMQALEPEREIRTALYFPLLGELREQKQHSAG